MKRKLSILIVVLLLMLVGCESRNPWLFFGDGKCRLPCWYGLTPNQTTLSESTEILKSLPFVDRQSIEIKTLTIAKPPEVVVSWNFTWDAVGNGYLVFDANGNRLEHIKVAPRGLYLGHVIDTLGNPTSALAKYHRDPGGQYYFLWVFYPERGIGAEAIGHPISDETGSVDITRDMIVSEILLYDPGRGVKYYIAQDIASWQETAQSYIKRLLPWPGFGEDMMPLEKR